MGEPRRDGGAGAVAVAPGGRRGGPCGGVVCEGWRRLLQALSWRLRTSLLLLALSLGSTSLIVLANTYAVYHSAGVPAAAWRSRR